MVRNGRLMEERRVDRSGGAVRRILNALADGERCVSEIVRITGLSQSNVSNHLARLRQRNWVRARRHGHQIHYALGQPDLLPAAGGGERRTPGALPRRAEPAAPIVPALAADYLAALLRLDEARAGAVAEEALSRGLDWKAIGRRVMEPALIRVGDLWAEGELTAAEEHAATAITTRLHERLTADLHPPRQPIGRAVVAGVTGNQHTLGVRMTADYLTSAGWETHFLGSDLPEADLLAIVQRLRPDAVLLGASLDDQLPALWSAVARLRAWRQESGSPLPLIAAGGRCFAAATPEYEPPLAESRPDLQGSDPDQVLAQLGSLLTAASTRGVATDVPAPPAERQN